MGSEACKARRDGDIGRTYQPGPGPHVTEQCPSTDTDNYLLTTLQSHDTTAPVPYGVHRFASVRTPTSMASTEVHAVAFSGRCRCRRMASRPAQWNSSRRGVFVRTSRAFVRGFRVSPFSTWVCFLGRAASLLFSDGYFLLSCFRGHGANQETFS